MLLVGTSTLFAPKQAGWALVDSELTLALRYQNRGARKLALVVDDGAAQAVSAWRQEHPGTELLADDALDGETGWLAAQRPAAAPLELPVITPPSLADLKAAKLAAIDARTDALIAEGFLQDGKRFSLSEYAQLKWTGMYAAREAMPYPVLVPTIGDTEIVQLEDEEEVAAFYMTAVGTVQVHLTAGITLKQNVMAAQDRAAVEAVTDLR